MSSWLSSLGDTIKNSAEDLTRGVQGKETGRAESVVVTFEGSALGLTVTDHGGEGVLSALAPGGEAERLGVNLGDRVFAVGGAPTFKYPDVVDAIRSRPDRPLQLNLERRSASEGQLGLVTFRLDEECDKAPARRPSTRAVLAPAGRDHPRDARGQSHAGPAHPREDAREPDDGPPEGRAGARAGPGPFAAHKSSMASTPSS